MDFGIFNIMQQRDPAKSAKQIFDEAVEQTVAAEQLGYSRAWYAEHHFSNYSLCPSPLMMVAHMAGRTSRIRLGTAVVVAPLYTPARLLAEIGMVDNLSNGRLDLGIGMGYQQYEFDRFCSTLENVREFTGEMLELIHRGLSQTAFEYQGKHIKFPRSSIFSRPSISPCAQAYSTFTFFCSTLMRIPFPPQTLTGTNLDCFIVRLTFVFFVNFWFRRD